MKLAWYVHRLGRMSVDEVSARVQVAARQRYWANPGRRPSGLETLRPGPRRAEAALRRAQAPQRTSAGAAAVIAAADRLMGGQWPVFHLRDATVGQVPDWFRDPLTGRVAPAGTYAFAVPYRDEGKVGNIKYVWELSRHQATTMLACAWWLTGEDRYAERVGAHLRSWWQANPFLAGVHWASAIEAGLRLLSWTWIRALLADWPGSDALFDANDAFARQLYHHQRYIRAFHSRGSSANNHLIAELAGLATAATCFPWFTQSAEWASWARTGLVEQAALQTHADGFNREQASEYHLFVFEMLAAAALAAKLAGQDFPASLDAVMAQMADALAASLDARGQMPRFGDGDDGRGVLLDAPATDRVGVVLDVARASHGPAAWWPGPAGTVLGHVAQSLAGAPAHPRPIPRPDVFPDTGMTILRAGSGLDEIWARCDAGPHGFLSIAAHGHADALSIEVRRGGTEILADPGTYCYHGETAWRDYFKGTQGHNTLTVDGQDQARSGGPFLWLDQPRSRVAEAGRFVWQASHDGYRRLAGKVTHHRRVALDEATQTLSVQDWIEAEVPQDVALALHLGPELDVALEGVGARLRWPAGAAAMRLPMDLAWSLHRGETAPPLGWYSRGFGHKTPSNTLVGRGRLAPGVTLATTLEFLQPGGPR